MGLQSIIPLLSFITRNVMQKRRRPNPIVFCILRNFRKLNHFVLTLSECASPFKDDRADFLCTSLLRTQFTYDLMRESARQKIKWTMIGQMANAIALPGFDDLGFSVTPIFLLVDHFLYWICTFSEKMKKIYRLEVWFFVFAKRTIEFR